MPDQGSETPAQAARALVRAADRAVLATALARPERQGWPYASLVTVAVDHDLSPLLLLSDLAVHTRNFAAEPRASLLFDATSGLADPLTGARLTLLGRVERTADERLRARYLARHPAAAQFAGFGDFNLYRVAVEAAHLVAGFGRIHWVEAADLLGDPPPPALVAAEAGILAHMNADHADAVEAYATGLLSRRAGPWQLTGVDRDGCDLRLEGEVARLAFEKPVVDAESARVELVRLVKQARRADPHA